MVNLVLHLSALLYLLAFCVFGILLLQIPSAKPFGFALSQIPTNIQTLSAQTLTLNTVCT